MTPFIGAGVGMSFVMPSEGDTQKALGLTFPIGVAIPLLDENVALTVGTAVNVGINLEEAGGSILSIPIGYLGVESFW